LTIGLGDDLVMRLSVDSTENLRTSLLTTLHACRLPKVFWNLWVSLSAFETIKSNCFNKYFYFFSTE